MCRGVRHGLMELHLDRLLQHPHANDAVDENDRAMQRL